MAVVPHSARETARNPPFCLLFARRSEPAFAFTRARPVDHQIDTPGPKYSPVAGLGKQLLSLNATAPVVQWMHFRFGDRSPFSCTHPDSQPVQARFGTAKQRPEINDSCVRILCLVFAPVSS